jgi:(+)-pinoresinol hydroxylase
MAERSAKGLRRAAAPALFMLSLTEAALASDAAAIARGRQVFEAWCSGCHAPNPPQPAALADRNELAAHVFAGTYVLEQKYKGTRPAALEERTDLTRDDIAHIVRKGAGIMPRTRKTEISDAALADLAAYLTRNNKEAVHDR